MELKILKIFSFGKFSFSLFNQYIGFGHNNIASDWAWRQDLGFLKLVKYN